jgi:hypothetical protein
MNASVLKFRARGILGLCIWFVCASRIAAQEAPRFIEPWGALFAEERAIFHVQTGGLPVGWSLSLSGAVVARGETPAIDQVFPPLRDSVVVEGVLTAENSQGHSTKPIWLFSRKPGFPAIEKLRVFDPVGSTATLLESNGIPFQPVAAIDALEGSTNGVLIVGSGISTDENKGLAPALCGAAARGMRILWLTPAAGRMGLPGGEEGPLPAVDYRDESFIPAMDKRLHAEDWRGRKAVASSFRLVGDRRMVEMEWSAGGGGWCWMDARWHGGGRLVVCGLSIVESWEDNPAPRYLLARWLAELNKTE